MIGRIERRVLIAGGTLAIASVALLFVAASGSAGTRLAQSRTRRLLAEATASRRATAAAPKEIGAARIPPRIEDQALALQALLGSAASREGVVLSSYEAAADAAPYVSKYGSPASGNGWLVIEARVAMSGTMRGVYATLRRVGRGPIPVEATSLQLRPSSTRPGSVDATLTLGIIVRPADSTGVGAGAGGDDANR